MGKTVQNEAVSLEPIDVLRQNCESSSQDCTDIRGDFNKCFGKRNSHQASASPNCGPGKQRDHHFQSQTSDAKVDVAVHAVVRKLMTKSVAFASRADTLMHNLMPKLKTDCLGHARTLLVTMNFFNSPHKDPHDEFSEEDMETVEAALRECTRLTHEESLCKGCLDRCKDRFGVRVSPDTTCGHQFIAAEGVQVEWFEQCFMPNLLGVAVKLHHRSSINFVRGPVEHSTATPLVAFPTEEVSVPSSFNGNYAFAWGAGGAGGPSHRQFINVCNGNWTHFKIARNLPATMTPPFFLNFVQAHENNPNGAAHDDPMLGNANLATMREAAEGHIAFRNAHNNNG